MIISSQRHLFSIPRDICYLNAAYMGPQTKAIIAAGHDGIDLRAAPWDMSEGGFFTTVEEVRSLSAQLISAPSDDIALIPAASYGIAIAAKNIKLKKGQSIVLLQEQFPSNVYSWRRMADEQGLKIIEVQKPKGGNWSDAVMEVIEAEGENIGLLALPACHWADGGLLDLKTIAAKAKSLGSYLVLELTQSVGALPFSIKEVDADYVVVANYKWLLCPYGTGFVYVAPRHQNGIPLEENWINREGSENFAGLVNYQDNYQKGARRFDVGERASFSIMPQVKEALSQILAWGVDNIAETLADKNKSLREIFANAGFQAHYHASNMAHILAVESEQALPQGFMDSLKARGVRLSVRGNALRVAPHLYNDDEDFARLSSALKKSMTG